MWNHSNSHSENLPNDTQQLTHQAIQLHQSNNHTNEMTHQEKLERSFDLSLYLNYVQQLFNAPSSDSENSDEEVQRLPSDASNNMTTANISSALTPLSNQSGQCHYQDIMMTPASADHENAILLLSSASSLHLNHTSSSSSSPSDLSSSDTESNIHSTNNLNNGNNVSSIGKVTPISDEELYNLLEIHKAWKKSPYPLGSPADIMSLLNATRISKASRKLSNSNNASSSTSILNQMETENLPNISTMDMNSTSDNDKISMLTTSNDDSSLSMNTDSQLMVGSDKNDNSIGGSFIDSKNLNLSRSRKQSFKILRKEELNAIGSKNIILPSTTSIGMSASSVTSSSNISSSMIPNSSILQASPLISTAAVSIALLNTDSIDSMSNMSSSSSSTVQTATLNTLVASPIDTLTTPTLVPSSDILETNDEDDSSKSNIFNIEVESVVSSIPINKSLGPPVNFMDEDDESEEDDMNDNDSLSDYVSMAATVQSAGGQILNSTNSNTTVQNIANFNKNGTIVNTIKTTTSNSMGGGTSSSFITTTTSTKINQGTSKLGNSTTKGKLLVSSSSSSSSSATTTTTTTTAAESISSSTSSTTIAGKKTIKGGKDVLMGGKTKKLSPQKQAKLIEVLNLKRRRVYVLLCKKEIGKQSKQRTNNHKENLIIKRRLAQACTRSLRQKAIQSQKIMKESVWRAKRLTREMEKFWKISDRVEREVRKRREKEAEEQRKMDVELMEAKRQQRKLNFLITQTELYAHFMSKKLGGQGGDESRILSQLNEDEKNSRLTYMDDYDSETMKAKAKANVQNAFKTQLAQVQVFDMDAPIREDFKRDLKLEGTGEETREEHAQPNIFTGVLKHYQLKGLNWLINLYDQGLGKTVQSIAFLAHVAEQYHVWGPFLIIAPASTLHNWQQEFKRFVPNFKVVPYWGNPQERKILRQFWQQSNLHTEEASFHVVITSYQIVMTDLKYFNRIKWQYLILDEAQAIKSTASARWKMLLGFSCRNRLLLTGTPIQNTMGELWALLHFIMPSLFDSHEEFNEWFSKDIESHAENKSSIDEKHLFRLHLILKPFMLRRVKKDVENELSDKIEVLVYCPLTTRQRLLYTALKKKIRIEDLLKSSGPSNSQLAQHATTNLMNLVMQFRKVCNHPDLFERREIQSPFFLPKVQCIYPKLIFREAILHLALPSKRHLLENKLSIFNPEHVHRSLSSLRLNTPISTPTSSINSSCSSKLEICEWSFLRFCGIGIGELFNIVHGGLIERWKQLLKLYLQLQSVHHQRFWRKHHKSYSSYIMNDDQNCEIQVKEEPDEEMEHIYENQNLLSNLSQFDFLIWPDNPVSYLNVQTSSILKELVFTHPNSSMYTFTDHKIYRIPETIEHRKLRSRNCFPGIQDPPLLPEIPFNSSGNCVQIRTIQQTVMPKFLYYLTPKLGGAAREIYFHDRSAAWWQNQHQLCTNVEGYNLLKYGQPHAQENHWIFCKSDNGGLSGIESEHGWSKLTIPDREKHVTDSGKLSTLDSLLKKLKMNGHRVLIYSQMTKMIDILEDYIIHRKWTYMRLDGSSKIAERRDMVADFQSRSDIFVFLLSTRAGGLGINLTAADTVIFYDSDWNPTVDQQAMDRAHRLGQTKQVHVYRLICKGTIEERILERAREKNEIQRMVISGGNFKSDTLKPKEVVSLLLDDEELERKYRQKQAERKLVVEEAKNVEPSTSASSLQQQPSLKRKLQLQIKVPGSFAAEKSLSLSSSLAIELASNVSSSAAGSVTGSIPGSPSQQSDIAGEIEIDSEVQENSNLDDDVSTNDGSLAEEVDSNMDSFKNIISEDFESDFQVLPKKPKIGRGRGRGRPRVDRSRGRGQAGVGVNPGPRSRGRPRLRPIGPLNQGVRGRRPGRPPLNRNAVVSSSLTPLTTSQRVFGFYSSPDLDLS